MSKLTKLEGTIVYCMVDRPRDCYEKEKGQEFKCGIVLTDEDVVDQFNDTYTKQAAKKVKTADFEAEFKCPPPEGAGKNVWVITLRKNTKLSNGEPVPDKYLPRVFQRKGAALVDITKTILPANGSKGAISIDHYDAKLGAVARLKNVLITDLIEYERSSGASYEPGDEFEADIGEGRTQKVPEKVIAKSSKPAAKAPVEEEESSSPF